MPKKKTATKKSSAKAKATKPTKAAFVRSQPASMSAKEVIAKAEEAGIKLNAMTVYKTRSLTNQGSKGKKAGALEKKASAKAVSISSKARGRSPDKKNRVLDLAAENPEWSAEQVAKAAKCSTNYVYSVWGGSKKRGGSANGTAKPKSPVSQHLDHVRALRGVILHVGIDRAKEMMDQIVKDLMILA